MSDAGSMSLLRVSRILHAGYVFECDGTRVVFDPIFENPFSGNCHAFPAVHFDVEQIRAQRFDAVFLSHFHEDHFSLASLDLIDRRTPIYFYCAHDELFALVRELGFERVEALAVDRLVSVGPVDIIPRRALDSDVDSLFQIRAAGLNVLNVVDALIDDETIEQLVGEGKWDVILWPFQTLLETDVLAPSRAGPASTSLPPEWIEQLARLRPRFVVPSSCQFRQEPWSWYNQAMYPITYRQFAGELERALPETRVVRMNPSVSLELSGDAFRSIASLPWVQPVGDQGIDYEYDPNWPRPSTAEIAQHFPALAVEQKEAVREFCRHELPRRYRELGPPPGAFFQKARAWDLVLYDAFGTAEVFRYLVDEDVLAAAEENRPAEWRTEIPIYKLHAAASGGEGLTSLYVRVNDFIFPPKLEQAVAETDVLEDPLIRCLSLGAVGEFQRAQLRRLREER